MDTDSRFRFEEHFSSFEAADLLSIDDDSVSMEGAFGASAENVWEWEVERELNGDIALIPMSSEMDMNYSSDCPPIRGDFQNIMSELHLEVPDMETLNTHMPLSADDEHIASISPNPSLPALDVTESPANFDLIEFTNADVKPVIKFNRPSGKKIDMNAQCYILENGEESENEFQQDDFLTDEADFVPLKSEPIDIDYDSIPDLFLKSEPQDNQLEEDFENDYVDVDTISEQNTPILQAGDLNSLLEQFEATETSQYFESALQLPADEELFEVQAQPKDAVENKPMTQVPSSDFSGPVDVQSTPPPPPPNAVAESSVSSSSSNSVVSSVPANVDDDKKDDENDKNKQILDALPQELIMRIKACSKRRVIPIIDPIPNKRRGVKKAQPEVPSVQQAVQDKEESVKNSEFVQLDHDYCSQQTPYPKHPQKDSGFESAEEDEQRNILRNQPTVKGANGKLMVSLLKINTIRSSIASEIDNKKKRKLNLEEYKKRREGFIRSCDNSQSNSPVNSGRNSPTAIEDEKMRLLKHQQKLMQMAAEVLKTPPKSARKTTAPTETASTAASPSVENFTIPPRPRTPPRDLEKREVVSIGMNTEITCRDVILAWKRLSTPAVELEEIKPILQKASAKINNNSLITSVIESIRHKKKLQSQQSAAQDQLHLDGTSKEQQQGEDKVISYLNKCRPAVATNTVEVQTEPTAEFRARQKRRRSSSSDSSDHRKSYKRRSGSNDSRHSYSSHTSSTHSSRSRSRSPSPQRVNCRKTSLDAEYKRAVEERRVVYVGGLSLSTTKEILRERFERFGPIVRISMHFRESTGHFWEAEKSKYGFLMFLHREDAYAAVDHGSKDPTLSQYEISFGGRRIFCGTSYSDLDNVQDDSSYSPARMMNSFDHLLSEAQADLRKRKSCT